MTDSTPPRLIVTGDDFGASPEVNAAIEAYNRAGALDQASLMVAAPCAAEAVEIARRNPRLRVGLHLTLCDGAATRPSVLTDSTGQFIRSPAWAGLAYVALPWWRIALREEIARQFAAFAAFGLPPTYWDGHTHLHLHPVIFDLTLPIAHAAGFRSVRLVREPGSPELVASIFESLSTRVIPRLQSLGIDYADRVFGLRATGRMCLADFQTALAAATSGLTEVYFHPGAELSPPTPTELAHALRRAEAQPLGQLAP